MKKADISTGQLILIILAVIIIVILIFVTIVLKGKGSEQLSALKNILRGII